MIGQQTRGVFVGRGQGRQLPDQRRGGRRRRRHESGDLGPVARRRRLVEGLRQGRHGLARPAVRCDETTAGLRAALFVDQTNTAWFPSDGYGFVGTAYAAMTSFGSALSYQRLEGTARGIHSWGDNVFNVAVSGGTALGSDMPAYESFTLGGPLRLSGYRINEFSGREYAFGRLMYYHRLYSLPDILGSGLYLGGSGGSRLHRQSLRQRAVAGNAMVRIGVPRCGYVPRAGVPGPRLRRSRQLEPLPAARRAVVLS